MYTVPTLLNIMFNLNNSNLTYLNNKQNYINHSTQNLYRAIWCSVQTRL